MSETGHLWLVSVDKSATPAVAYADADWQLIGGQRGVDFSRSLGTADATTKDSENNEEVLATNRSKELSLDNLFELSDTGLETVEKMHDSRQFRWVKLTNGTITWYHWCLCTEFSLSAPEDDAVSCSITFKPSGASTRTPALT